MDRLWLKAAEVRAKVPAGVHYFAAPPLVINLFAASPFHDSFYHVIALSMDLMHKTSSASFGLNNWLMVTYQSLNAFRDWRNHPSLRNATNSFKKSGVHKLKFASSVLLNRQNALISIRYCHFNCPS